MVGRFRKIHINNRLIEGEIVLAAKRNEIQKMIRLLGREVTVGGLRALALNTPNLDPNQCYSLWSTSYDALVVYYQTKTGDFRVTIHLGNTARGKAANARELVYSYEGSGSPKSAYFYTSTLPLFLGKVG
jgi:hypothetical protein